MRFPCIEPRSYDCETKTKFGSIFRMVLPVVIAGVLTTVGAYIGTPTVLSALGFTKAGVAVGSMAAAVQTPATAAGGFFALCQSAGVLGLAASTKAAISAVAGAVVSVAAYVWPWSLLL
ncbi:interferon alpha-inducible protein 27-like protein 2B isoform X1 [Crassostrea angulata]|uniref:interferon alpha-inducible protein 27-like protein 2B isoform X1 n=1 Tax=Magallana angulata TaxID=2784310 RepID=UPI0005C3B779|nr:interferon alpha-inducible protein 27-like protein 2B isoform X1 [Crassostrea angulata]|eukprot:XP_011455011.1 PREDICTED: interferon alpha-inducible protein 27-like protein 2B [Crassostrea gigas]